MRVVQTFWISVNTSSLRPWPWLEDPFALAVTIACHELISNVCNSRSWKSFLYFNDTYFFWGGGGLNSMYGKHNWVVILKASLHCLERSAKVKKINNLKRTWPVSLELYLGTENKLSPWDPLNSFLLGAIHSSSHFLSMEGLFVLVLLRLVAPLTGFSAPPPVLGDF